MCSSVKSLVMLSNASRNILRVFLIVSPIFVASFLQSFEPADSIYLLPAIAVVVIGVPAIGAVGLFVSTLTRNSRRPELYSMLGYALTTLIVWGYLFMSSTTYQLVVDFF